jgi:hypothetical protein
LVSRRFAEAACVGYADAVPGFFGFFGCFACFGCFGCLAFFVLLGPA